MPTNEATYYATSDGGSVEIQGNEAANSSNRSGPCSKPAINYLATAELPSNWDADNRHFGLKSFSRRRSAAAN